jgi:peptidyl-prolyl cis-trans isomerase D
VWNTFITNKIIEKEASKLGLTVTDEEMQNILREGTDDMLRQTPFINQQTGRFDVTQLQKFLNDYKTNQAPQLAEQYKSIYDYWKFVEKSLRQKLLTDKYQTLISRCLISNPVSAKALFDATHQESNILLASMPYSQVKDDDVKISDAELKAEYDKKKELFKQYVETRDIKYVDFQVKPSMSDRDALMKTMVWHCKSRKKMDGPIFFKKLEMKRLLGPLWGNFRPLPEFASKSFSQQWRERNL